MPESPLRCSARQLDSLDRVGTFIRPTTDTPTVKLLSELLKLESQGAIHVRLPITAFQKTSSWKLIRPIDYVTDA